jgi:hypothetical protein
MQLRLLVLAALAGCPPPPRYLVADVYAANAPVEHAMVAATCGGKSPRGVARRTDETGRARLELRGDMPASECSLTIAKPGFPTIETRHASTCTSVANCPPLAIFLEPGFARRSYASPPAEIAQ